VDNNGAELWKFKADRWIEGGPVVGSDGAIYFGCFDSNLYALYPDGSLKWKFDTGGWIWSAPAIAEDGTSYIGSYDGFLYAINNDGSLKWKISIGTTSSSPAIAEDGTIYMGTMGNKIYAINPDGTEKWQYQTGYKITSDPAIGNNGIVYIGSGDTYLYAMYSNGTLKWRFKTGHYIKGPPSIAEDGIIYVGSWDDYLYALFPDGSLKWKCKVGAGTETNPSIGPDGTIYVGGSYLWAINPQDGTKKWSFDLGTDQHVHQSSPAVSADGIIYVGTNIGETSGGDIIAVNPDGTERWRHRTANNWVESSPCIGEIGENGIVYIGSSSDDDSGYSYGYLYAFGPGEANNPPNTPTITGPTSGKAGEYHRYIFQTTDPEGHEIYYYVDWGDDTSTHGWAGPYNSGEALSLDHLYTFEGTYIIKAKAKDEYDSESDWATLEVSIPKNKLSNSISFLQVLEKIIQRFPILERILLRPFQ
jgi:outer membrane protein assembly factor BamB